MIPKIKYPELNNNLLIAEMKYLANVIKLITFQFSRKYLKFSNLSYSEIKLNKILYRNFISDTHEFSVIIVGANDGISFDSLYEFLVRKRNVCGIAIEPDSLIFNELKKNFIAFSKIKLCNKAVHPQKKK